jgi:flagellar M-ring protein FliF
MHRLEQLAQAAVGFDANRGDQVVIENVSFSTNATPVKTATAEKLADELKSFLRAEPGMMRTLMMGLSAMMLVLFVLRPVAKQVNTILREPFLQPSLSSPMEFAATETPGLSDGESKAEESAKSLPRVTQLAINSGVFDRVSDHIRREPAQSVKLLESWIGAEGED